MRLTRKHLRAVPAITSELDSTLAQSFAGALTDGNQGVVIAGTTGAGPTGTSDHFVVMLWCQDPGRAGCDGGDCTDCRGNHYKRTHNKEHMHEDDDMLLFVE